jgi:hypothetical protein
MSGKVGCQHKGQEGRGLKSLRRSAHHPKPDTAVRSDRTVPNTKRTATEPGNGTPTTTAYYSILIIITIQQHTSI